MAKEANKILISFNLTPKVEIKGDINKKYHVEFIDGDTNQTIHSTTIKNGMWTVCSRRWYTNWVIKVNDKIVHKFDITGKNIKISLESKAVGDTLAWAPQVIEFQKKYKCNVTLSTFHNHWFQTNPAYKDIKFKSPGYTDNEFEKLSEDNKSNTNNKFYAHFSLGWFQRDGKWDEGQYHLNQPNTIPIIQSTTDMLGLPYKEITYGLSSPELKRPYKEKYICIGPRSTAGLKEWPHHYWSMLAEGLNKEGYKVVSISHEGFNQKNIINKGKMEWEDTINHLRHAELFIGLGSGLSWVNWTLGKHTVMINNFVPYGFDFTQNLTKIEDYSVCNNCWADKKFMFDKGKWDWCPRHQGTMAQHICHKAIKPEIVLKKIKYLLRFK